MALSCGTESSLEAVQVLVSTLLTDPHMETLPEVMSERAFIYPPLEIIFAFVQTTPLTGVEKHMGLYKLLMKYD